MGKFKKAMKVWRRMPRKTRRRIKRKAQRLVGRDSNSKKRK